MATLQFLAVQLLTAGLAVACFMPELLGFQCGVHKPTVENQVDATLKDRQFVCGPGYGCCVQKSTVKARILAVQLLTVRQAVACFTPYLPGFQRGVHKLTVTGLSARTNSDGYVAWVVLSRGCEAGVGSAAKRVSTSDIGIEVIVVWVCPDHR